MATEAEIAWAAGLFDGEGCFTSWRRGSKTYVKCQLGMADEDVVRRFGSVVGCGTIRLRPRRVEGWSAIYEWQTASAPDVIRVATLLLPWLGQRRTAKALETVELARQTRPAAKNRTHCMQGHPYEGANLRVEGDGTYAWRRCRECKREYDQTRRKKVA